MASDPTVRALSKIADMELRLRRALDLVGEIGTAFHPDAATPVVQVDDATRPGCNGQRNRAFAGFSEWMAVGGNSVSLYLRADAPVILDRCWATCGQKQTGSAQDWGATNNLMAVARRGDFTLPALGAGVTAFTPAYYIERPSLYEVVPITGRAAQNAGLVAGFAAVDALSAQAGTSWLFNPSRVFLDVGDCLAFQITVDAGVVGNYGAFRWEGKLF